MEKCKTQLARYSTRVNDNFHANFRTQKKKIKT